MGSTSRFQQISTFAIWFCFTCQNVTAMSTTPESNSEGTNMDAWGFLSFIRSFGSYSQNWVKPHFSRKRLSQAKYFDDSLTWSDCQPGSRLWRACYRGCSSQGYWDVQRLLYYPPASREKKRGYHDCCSRIVLDCWRYPGCRRRWKYVRCSLLSRQLSIVG